MLEFTQILSEIIKLLCLILLGCTRRDSSTRVEASPHHNTAHPRAGPRHQQTLALANEESNLDFSQQKGSECTFSYLIPAYARECSEFRNLLLGADLRKESVAGERGCDRLLFALVLVSRPPGRCGMWACAPRSPVLWHAMPKL